MNNETDKQIVKAEIITNSRGLILRNIEEMYRFAQAVVKSKIAPSSFQTPEQILIAVQTGAEIGLMPMQSLQSLCVVNGQARLWGDTPMALVRRSGLMEWMKETIEGEDDDMVAICEAKRKEEPESQVRKFSVNDAKQAGLWQKKGTWQSYPKRMLQLRARSFLIRDVFPDALNGATIAEEYEGIELPQTQPTPVVLSRESRKQAEDVVIKDNLTAKIDVLIDETIKILKSEKHREFNLDETTDRNLLLDVICCHAQFLFKDDLDYADRKNLTDEKLDKLLEDIKESGLPQVAVALIADPLEANLFGDDNK